MPDYNLESRVSALEEDNTNIKGRLTTAENAISTANGTLTQVNGKLTAINSDLTTIKQGLNDDISSYTSEGLIFQTFKDIGLDTLLTFPDNTITSSTGLTFEIYTKYTEIPNTTNNEGTLFECHTGTSGTGLYFALYLSGTALEANVGGTAITSSTVDISVPVDTKHTITAVLTSEKTKFYFDGVYVSESNTTATLGSNIRRYNNRASLVTANKTIIGTNYNLRIYNRALTAEEIATNHRADIDRYDKIVLPGSKPIVNGYIPISVKVSMTTSATAEVVTE